MRQNDTEGFYLYECTFQSKHYMTFLLKENGVDAWTKNLGPIALYARIIPRAAIQFFLQNLWLMYSTIQTNKHIAAMNSCITRRYQSYARLNSQETQIVYD